MVRIALEGSPSTRRRLVRVRPRRRRCRGHATAWTDAGSDRRGVAALRAAVPVRDRRAYPSTAWRSTRSSKERASSRCATAKAARSSSSAKGDEAATAFESTLAAPHGRLTGTRCRRGGRARRCSSGERAHIPTFQSTLDGHRLPRLATPAAATARKRPRALDESSGARARRAGRPARERCFRAAGSCCPGARRVL